MNQIETRKLLQRIENELSVPDLKKSGPILGELLIPMVGILRAILIEAQEQDERRRAALEHLKKQGNNLETKTAIGIFLDTKSYLTEKKL